MSCGAPSRSDAPLPIVAGAIAECGVSPLEPFPGVEPAAWASAPDALVFGRVTDVRFVDGPFARFLCGEETDPVREECSGNVEQAL